MKLYDSNPPTNLNVLPYIVVIRIINEYLLKLTASSDGSDAMCINVYHLSERSKEKETMAARTNRCTAPMSIYKTNSPYCCSVLIFSALSSHFSFARFSSTLVILPLSLRNQDEGNFPHATLFLIPALSFQHRVSITSLQIERQTVSTVSTYYVYTFCWVVKVCCKHLAAFLSLSSYLTMIHYQALSRHPPQSPFIPKMECSCDKRVTVFRTLPAFYSSHQKKNKS